MSLPRTRRDTRRRTRRGPWLPLSRPDAREVARFLRPQLPLPVPDRAQPGYLPGLVGLAVLGYRVIRPGQS